MRAIKRPALNFRIKILIVSLLLCAISSSCSPDDKIQDNPYLADLNFSFEVDLSLPQYNEMNFPGNSIITRNYGINGVVIYNLNNDQYVAYELTDPNHPPLSCSSLVVEGTKAICQCDDQNAYTIITGQLLEGEGPYALKAYRVERNGNFLVVSN